MKKQRSRVEVIDENTVRVKYSDGYGTDGKASVHIYTREGQFVVEVGSQQRLCVGDLTAFDGWKTWLMVKGHESFVSQMRKAVKDHCDHIDAVA